MVASAPERHACPFLDGRRLAAVGMEELECLCVVVGDEIGAMSGNRRDPGCRETVFSRPRRSRKLRIRDVPNERVAEGELHLARHRCRALTPQELLPDETLKSLVDSLAGAERSDAAAPEHLAEDRRSLEQLLLVDLEGVEARRDHALHGVRQ